MAFIPVLVRFTLLRERNKNIVFGGYAEECPVIHLPHPDRDPGRRTREVAGESGLLVDRHCDPVRELTKTGISHLM